MFSIVYRVCASEIRSLRSCSCLDRDYELVIETLTCDFFNLNYWCVLSTTPIMVCAIYNNNQYLKQAPILFETMTNCSFC